MAEPPLKDDLLEARWKRLEAAVEWLSKLIHELLEEDQSDRCSQVA